MHKKGGGGGFQRRSKTGTRLPGRSIPGAGVGRCRCRCELEGSINKGAELKVKDRSRKKDEMSGDSINEADGWSREDLHHAEGRSSCGKCSGGLGPLIQQ